MDPLTEFFPFRAIFDDFSLWGGSPKELYETLKNRQKVPKIIAGENDGKNKLLKIYSTQSRLL